LRVRGDLSGAVRPELTLRFVVEAEVLVIGTPCLINAVLEVVDGESRGFHLPFQEGFALQPPIEERVVVLRSDLARLGDVGADLRQVVVRTREAAPAFSPAKMPLASWNDQGSPATLMYSGPSRGSNIWR
jgi:hypothetical protein